MPFFLTWFERQIFLNRNLGPGPILDMFAPLAFRAVHAGYKLGVFEMLEAGGPLTAQQAAQKAGADAHGMQLLLDALCSLGYLRCRSSRFANSAMTRKWMVTNAMADLGGMFGYFDDASARWEDLDKTIVAGKPAQTPQEWFDGHTGAWQRYHAGLRSTAELLAGTIASRAKLRTGAKRLIDIGGSHGLYSVRFCQRYPGLSAVIFDQQAARSTALETIAAHKMEQRMTFTEGNALTDNLGSGYDAALLVNFIRVLEPHEAATVLAKAFAALNPGGMIFVADQFGGSKRTSFGRANALLILLELYATGSVRAYTAADVKRMAVEAGFSKPRVTKVPRSPGIRVVSAQKPK